MSQACFQAACGEGGKQRRPAEAGEDEPGQRAVGERPGGGRAADLLGHQAQLD
jgi:hypothetical protein